MKIIVVNISKTIEERGSLKATQRAWKLKRERANKYKFVIGLNKGEIHPFRLLDVKRDDIHTNDRIKFILDECSDIDRKEIKKYIDEHIKDKSFKYVTTKYIN